MRRGINRATSNFNWARWRARVAVCLALGLAVSSGGCFSSEEGETFYGRVSVPDRQEFRWSDGGLPQVFDPALAAAPPDTDVVRAMFEGLTEYDPQTLAPVSGVAWRWESSRDNREWTFHLRHDARWSNGEPVTAQDFVRSWQRTLRLGERAPHAKLLANLEGVQPKPTPQTVTPASPLVKKDESVGVAESKPVEPDTTANPAKAELGVEAVNDYTLKVRLQRPDKNFPALVAHPVFRPVYKSLSEEAAQRAVESNDEKTAGGEIANGKSGQNAESPVISNGAFHLSEQAADGVVLERAGNYWNARVVSLERVRFVAASDAEAALSAYRAGEVDAVTNANIEPLAMKLLTPYKDFRRATFGALTFYDFNTSHPPFDDLRVRQALSLAIDRKRLSADTLGGATEAAEKFLPFDETTDGGEPDADDSHAPKSDATKSDATKSDEAESVINYDAARARQLLAEAGYPGGESFPRVRLLVNRNEQHRAVAAAIAGMWRNVLGIETEIMLRNWDEYEEALRVGDYDLARRSVVMQTVDEETNMLAMFDPERINLPAVSDTPGNDDATAAASPSGRTETRADQPTTDEKQTSRLSTPAPAPVLTEQQAVAELPAIPIYFASSYALVKPYVSGFDANLLDAPSLQHVRIETNWQPPKRENKISIVSIR